MANILIGICGSIAAYKMADVTSQLKKLGHAVQCIVTDSASAFVTPLTLETLSGLPVKTDLFGPDISGTEHIDLARWADLYLISPATANKLAQLALGLAPDLVTTVALATRAPILIAPAMNTVMYRQPVVQDHIRTLTARGIGWVEPAEGILACGEEGVGKLASVETIVASVVAAVSPKDRALDGQHILITAGPTITAIDAVRYITNHSTGRMGAAMAEAALEMGARVSVVLGMDKGVVRPVAPAGTGSRLSVVEVQTAEEMAEAALGILPAATGVIASAAVMDYSVANPAANKLKRSSEPISLPLVPSTDVLATLRRAAKSQWFLGFAAETDDLQANGESKLRSKNLDFVFANPIARQGETAATGFAVPQNGGLLLCADGSSTVLDTMDKKALAAHILRALVASPYFTSKFAG